jgi:hypothetical protein
LYCPEAAFAAMERLAVIWVALTTDTFETVMPVPLTFTVAGDVKFAPVRVTGTDAPCDPVDGLIELNVGAIAAAVTLKGAVPLVPPPVVTDTLYCPVAAFEATVNVAVICVLLATTTFETVMPVPLTLTLAGDVKFVPVRVTGTDEPCVPVDGLTELNVGGNTAAVTLKGAVPLVPPDVVTETPYWPMAAFKAIVSVAVI